MPDARIDDERVIVEDEPNELRRVERGGERRVHQCSMWTDVYDTSGLCSFQEAVECPYDVEADVRAAVTEWLRHQNRENLFTSKQVSRHTVIGSRVCPEARKPVNFVIPDQMS